MITYYLINYRILCSRGGAGGGWGGGGGEDLSTLRRVHGILMALPHKMLHIHIQPANDADTAGTGGGADSDGIATPLPAAPPPAAALYTDVSRILEHEEGELLRNYFQSIGRAVLS